MGKLRWYKRDPDAALNGMANLTLEQRGAYNTVLDLIYSRDGAVDDDDRFIAGWLRCDIRIWKRVRGDLIRLGKLYVDKNQLRNSRADVEVDRGLQRVASVSEVNRIKGIKSGMVRRKINNLDEQMDEPKTNTTTTTTRVSKKEEESSSTLLMDLPEKELDWPKNYREIFWAEYPRKVEKKAAFAAIERVKKSGAVTFARLIAAIKTYAVKTSVADQKYIKHPTVWLNKGCWDDEYAPNGQHLNGHKTAGEVFKREDWERAFLVFKSTSNWPGPGPAPGKPGCLAPPDLCGETLI